MESNTQNIEHQKVIIVGAGISGFSAACKLLENDVTSLRVLEAGDRIGGRIQSVQFGDTFVDLGAEYVHGEEGNLVFQIAKDFLNKTTDNEFGWKMYYSNSEKGVDELLVQCFEQIYELEKNPGDPNITLKEAFNKRYDTHVLPKYKGNKEMEKIAEEFRKTAESILLSIEGSFDWEECRTKFHNFRLCPGNEVQPWSGKGYKTIFEALKKRIGVEKAKLLDSKINFKKTVTKIVRKRDADKKIFVECQDGSKYTADHLIFTASLGVLQHDHKKMFEPGLDEGKLKAMQALGIGGIFKVALEFPERWWRDDGEMYVVWSEEDEKKLFKDVPYGPSMEGQRHWLSGFHCVSNTAKDTVIVAWIAGHYVPAVEQMDEKELKAGLMYCFNKFIKATKKIPEPIRMVRSQWVTNPQFRGSFSYETPNMEKLLPSAHSEFLEPIKDESGVPRILFAGEATHPTRFSTADGSLASGFMQADKLIKYIQ
ncbi:spermine oxidase-like isoform X1 [Harmonia axyridis]|uniref:spermine oxidase-like isoform X1 n=1 Tax=Harmonia axyridis TaxID=115357 RepID=UPI001E278070|nr:spermine oxidase-like isoform X1 [Harmonia axyridis]